MERLKGKVAKVRLLSLKSKASLLDGVREPTPLLNRRPEGIKSRNSKLAQKDSAIRQSESERKMPARRSKLKLRRDDSRKRLKLFCPKKEIVL